MANFPTFPTSGKNAAVEVSTGDGPLLTLEAMTLQSSYEYRGEYYTDRIYLLGTGKTLLNMRPAELPTINIDGILQGCDVTPSTTNNQLECSTGIIEIDGSNVTAVAKTDLAVSRPATSKWAWNLVIIDEATGVFSVAKGTDTTDDQVTSLLTTYGSGAGQKPLIGVDKLLVAAVKVYSDSAAVIAPEYILYTDREFGGVDTQILPNIGGVLLQTALVKCHTGAIGRQVKYTGRYLDGLMVRVGTAKSWTLTPSTTEVSEDTFAGGYGQTEIGAWSFTFEQLAADNKVFYAALKRQGHCAVRLLFPNGYGLQSVATVAPTINTATGSMVSMNVSGSLGDFPVEYTG